WAWDCAGRFKPLAPKHCRVFGSVGVVNLSHRMPTVGILAATLLFAPSAAALGAFEAVPTLSSYVEAFRKAGITIPQTLSCSDGEQVKIFKTICPDGKLSKTIEITEENFSDF